MSSASNGETLSTQVDSDRLSFIPRPTVSLKIKLTMQFLRRILVIASRISLSSYGVNVRVRVVLKELLLVNTLTQMITLYELLIPLGSNHLLGYLLSVFCCLLPLRVMARVQSETFRR